MFQIDTVAESQDEVLAVNIAVNAVGSSAEARIATMKITTTRPTTLAIFSPPRSLYES